MNQKTRSVVIGKKFSKIYASLLQSHGLDPISQEQDDLLAALFEHMVSHRFRRPQFLVDKAIKSLYNIARFERRQQDGT